MAIELTTYTGKLQYRNVNFSFVFDGQELRLIAPDDKKREIEMEWLMTPIGKGVYTSGNSLKMDEPFLIGQCNENGKKMIVFIQLIRLFNALQKMKAFQTMVFSL